MGLSLAESAPGSRLSMGIDAPKIVAEVAALLNSGLAGAGAARSLTGWCTKRPQQWSPQRRSCYEGALPDSPYSRR